MANVVALMNLIALLTVYLVHSVILTEKTRAVMSLLENVATRYSIENHVSVVMHVSITKLSTAIGESHGVSRSGGMTGGVVYGFLYLTVRLVSVTLTGKTLVVAHGRPVGVETPQSTVLVICAQITDLLDSGNYQE